MKYELKPYKLKNTIQHYDWGDCNNSAYIPQLLGLKPEKDKPYAELWMGVHPNAPSNLIVGDQLISLHDYISAKPKEVLGHSTANRFKNKLPFLFKVLSAGEALSIQAHPNKKQAEQLHDIDPANYPDDNHKPEIAIAIDDLWALVGFRTVEELKESLNAYPEMASFIGSDLVESFLSEQDQERCFGYLKMLYKTMMSRSTEKVDELESSLAELTKRLTGQSSKKKEESLFLDLRAKYGTDAGLFNLFFLNIVRLTSGQAVFLPAGVPHAYLQGNIVECMANSDNVVRAGLTPKFKDVDALLEIVEFNQNHLPVTEPGEDDKLFKYPVPIQEFEITRLSLKANEKIDLDTNDSIQMMLVLQGAVDVGGSESNSLQNERFGKGDSFIIPAKMNRFSIFAMENSVLFIVNT